MADDRVKNSWSITNATLTCKFPSDNTLAFDLARVFPDFNKLTDAQKLVVGNGVHQKLGDSCARSKAEKLDEDGMVTQMNTTFEGIVDGTVWSKKGGKGGISLKKQIQDKAEANLNEADQKKLKDLMKKAGINIFG
jgi:hypothetical protein